MFKDLQIKLNKKIFLILILLGISIIFISCSSFKDFILGNNTKEEVYKIGKSEVYKVGEEVEVKRPTDEDENNIIYKVKVNSAKVYENPLEAGIAKERLVSSDYYGISKEPKVKEIDEIASGKILLCDIDITNINEEADGNITFLDLVLENSDKELNAVGLPVYLSNSIAVNSEDSNMYHFNLEKGKNTNLQVGFPVDDDVLKAGKLYLVDSYMAKEKLVSYIDLGLGE